MTDWIREPLHERHDLAPFDCGVDVLDRWLREEAIRAQRAGTARTYVWVAPDTAEVVAYYSITPTQVMRAEVGRSLSGGFSVIPGYLLARLALDSSLHGQHLGAQLLVDALETIVRAADTAAGRLIVVDAIDDNAHAFYRHHDFIPIDGTNRLVMKIATARLALGLDEG